MSRALTRLGPTYIKLGQFLATRPDIVGRDLASDLSTLQDRLPAFPLDAARSALAEDLGADGANAFTTFSEALAAASIAQVHKATLQDGRIAAVKILRPGIEKLCERDLKTLRFAAAWAERLAPAARRLEPKQFVGALADSLRMELDLRLEAAAASELAENLVDENRVRIPKVYWEQSSRRTFTMEWIDGSPISDKTALEAKGVNSRALADTVMQTFLHQSLRQGFFHADMHQGNLLVDERGRLALVDFGIMGRLDLKTRGYWAEILFGFLNRDYLRVAEIHFEAGYVPSTHSVHAFAQALRAVGEPIFGQAAQTISMSRLLAQLFDITALFDMHLRPELVLLQKTMVTVEGVARDLHTDHNMWECARPEVEAWMTERLGPPAKLREAAGGAASLGRLLQNLPELARKAELAAEHVSDEGVRLDAKTIQALAKAQAVPAKHGQQAALVAVAAILAAALSQLF